MKQWLEMEEILRLACQWNNENQKVLIDIFLQGGLPSMAG